MTADPARRLAVLRTIADADPDGDVAFLLYLLEHSLATIERAVDEHLATRR